MAKRKKELTNYHLESELFLKRNIDEDNNDANQPTNIANINISAGNTNSRMLSKVHQSLGKISKWNFRLNLKLIISHLIKVYLSIKTKNHIDRRRRTATL